MSRKFIYGLALAGVLALGVFGAVSSANAQSGDYCSRFNNGTEGWGPCPGYPNIAVTTSTTGGESPGDPYLQLTDQAGASAACSSDRRYTGNWLQKFAGCGHFCFDFRVFNWGDPPVAFTPQLNIFGGTGGRATFVANAVVPVGDMTWHTKICAPIASGSSPPFSPDGHWVVSGDSWDNIITNVTSILLPVDFTSSPSEVVGYDNICIGSGGCGFAILKVCKVAGPGITVGTPFTFTVGNNTITVPAGPAPGGNCVEVKDTTLVPGSNVTVTENIPSGDIVTAITVNPTSGLVGTPDLGAGTVTVHLDSGWTEVTYTNAKLPPPEPTGCWANAKVSVKCNPDGTYSVTVSGIGSPGDVLTLGSSTPGVSVSPPTQTWAPTTTWIISGATAGQTVVLTANDTKTGGGSLPGTDQCCSGEIKIVMPDCPKGEVVVEKKVKNETEASNAVINALSFPIKLMCPPSSINTTFNLNNGGTHTENNVPYGSVCTVTETGLPPPPPNVCPEGMAAVWSTPIVTPANATINAPVTAFTVVNELKCVKSGDLTVKKIVVNHSPLPLPPMTFPVTVTCGSMVTNLNLASDGTPQTITGIPLPNSCQVQEGAITTPPNVCPPGQYPSWSTNYASPNPVPITGTGAATQVENILNCTDKPPVIDVGINKTGGTTPYCPAPNYGWTITVTNNGAGWPATGNIVVSDTVPADMTFDPIVSPPWSCTPSGSLSGGTPFTCTYNGPAPTGTQTLPAITITATATAGPPFPPYVNCASVAIPGSSGYTDSNAGNNNVCTAPVVKPASCCPDGQVMNAAGICVPPPICQPPMVLNAAGVCGCPLGTVQEGERCVKIVIDCHQPLVPNPAGTGCICPLGTVPAGGTCVKPPACQPPMVPGPVAGQCICGPGYTLVGGECVKTPVCDPPKVPGPIAGQCICGRGYIQRGGTCVKETTCGPGTVERGGRCVKRVVCEAPAKLNRRGTGCDCPRGWTKKGNGCEQERKRPNVTPDDVLRVLPYVIPNRGGSGGGSGGGDSGHRGTGGGGGPVKP